MDLKVVLLVDKRPNMISVEDSGLNLPHIVDDKPRRPNCEDFVPAFKTLVLPGMPSAVMPLLEQTGPQPSKV